MMYKHKKLMAEFIDQEENIGDIINSQKRIFQIRKFDKPSKVGISLHQMKDHIDLVRDFYSGYIVESLNTKKRELTFQLHTNHNAPKWLYNKLCTKTQSPNILSIKGASYNNLEIVVSNQSFKKFRDTNSSIHKKQIDHTNFYFSVNAMGCNHSEKKKEISYVDTWEGIEYMKQFYDTFARVRNFIKVTDMSILETMAKYHPKENVLEIKLSKIRHN